MRPDLRRTQLVAAALALRALWPGVAGADEPGAEQRTRTGDQVQDRRPPPPAPPNPRPKPPPNPAPAPRPAPARKPPPPPPRSSREADDERILRDLELYMLYEMLNDYEMFYDDATADKKR